MSEVLLHGFLCWDVAPASESRALKQGVSKRKQAIVSHSRSWMCQQRQELELCSCGFCLERSGCGARHRDPASAKNKSQAWTKAKHLLCAFGSGWPGYLTPGNIFPFTLHCPGASITFLTHSPGMGIASTPKILRAVTHLSFQHPHLPNHAALSWSYR